MANRDARGRWLRDPASERFWPKVTWTKGPTDCWLWAGAHHGFGHGRFWVSPERPVVPAHAFARELVTGSRVPPGKMVLHHCDTPQCVNPDHLYVGTQKDNIRDMDRRGRRSPLAHGDGSGIKLSFADVCTIRESTESRRVLANRFGIHPTYVTLLRNPAKYGHRVSR